VSDEGKAVRPVKACVRWREEGGASGGEEEGGASGEGGRRWFFLFLDTYHEVFATMCVRHVDFFLDTCVLQG